MEMPTRRAPEDQKRKGSVGGWRRVRMVSTVDGQRLGSLQRRGRDTLSSGSGLGKGQEMEIHVDYAGDTERVGR